MHWKCHSDEGCPGVLSQGECFFDWWLELLCIKHILMSLEKFAGLGNISYCGCCSIRGGDFNSSFSAGDWSCVEGNSLWWFQEPLTGALACREVLEEGKYGFDKSSTM